MKRGRKKERTQISARIDYAVMDIAQDAIRGTETRITDMMERGLVLALRELGCTVPVSHHARLFFRDEGPAFAQLIVDLNTLRRLPEVRPLSAAEEAVRNFLMGIIASARQWPDADKVLALMGTPKDTEKQ